MFDPVWKLALGFLAGVVFGVLLQQGQVAKFRVIVGQFLLRDWTLVKIMGTAVVVQAMGIYAVLPTAVVSLHVKPFGSSGNVRWGDSVCAGLFSNFAVG